VKPRNYLAGVGWCLGCFHPTAILKIVLPDWPQIFR